MIFFHYDNFLKPLIIFLKSTQDYFYSKRLFFNFQISNLTYKIKYQIICILYNKKHEILLIKFKIEYDLLLLKNINNYTNIIFQENTVNNINKNLNCFQKFRFYFIICH